MATRAAWTQHATFMSNTFVDLSNASALRPLVATLAALGAIIDRVTRDWVIIGAFARDLLLHHHLGLPIRRMTRDVDLAVAVRSWEVFEEIRKEIRKCGGFTGPEAQRVHLGGLSFDIVPFGGVAEDDQICWPPDGEPRMTTLGLEEALTNAHEVLLPEGLRVRVASIPALTLLKLLAWADRHVERPRHDAPDLLQLVKSYSETWNEKQLYEDSDLLEAFGFDVELVGAALLGRDIRKIARGPSFAAVERILAHEADGEHLARDMGRDADANLRLIAAMLRGASDSET
jgi:predicted nucleotidyltransferase